MPTINDEDLSVDPMNAAERLERERIARATGQPELEIDPNEIEQGINDLEDYANQNSSDSAERSISGSGGGSSSKIGGVAAGSAGAGAAGGAATADTGTQSKLQQRLGAFWQGAANKYGKVLKNKWLVGAGVGGAGMGIVVLILLVMLSAYKIPHITENISAWRFARVMSRAMVQNERTMSTKIAIDAADESALSRLRATYNTGRGKVSDTWSKLDKYRPNKQISNLNASGMRFNYDGKRLVGITINDKTLLTPKTTFIKDRIPFYRFTQNINTAALFQPELNKALRAGETGPIVRGIVNTKLRKQLGINYVAWKAGQYKGKSIEQVRIAEEQANAKSVATKDSTKPVTQQLADDVADAEKAQEETVNDPDKVKQAIANDGVSSEVAEAVDKVGEGSAFKTILGVLSAPYAVAVPVCIVYDGSIDKSGSTVDANSARQQKSWNRLATVGDQQKDGATVDSKIIQAYDSKAGEPSNTVVMKRVSGKQYTTTDGAPSPQAGANGTYTLFDAFFQSAPDGAVAAANYVAGNACPILTNTWAALGIGIASLIPAFFTGGGSEAAMAAAGQAARVTITHTAEKAVARFSIKQGLRNVAYNITGGAKLKMFLGKEFAKGGAVAGTTLLAKYYVANKAGLINNGLEQKGDYITQADSGADLEANEISRRGQFGRPLSESEVKAANAETAEQVGRANASRSTYQRYFALSNPNSLLTNVGTTISGGLGGSSFTSFLHSVGSVFSPSNFARLTSNILNPTAQAAAASGEANYRNIQWGWTKAEIDKIRHNTSYEMLENQTILDNSGKEDEIANTYGKCFGTDDTTIGTLLANGDIKRDNEANVLVDDSLCSPKNLSFNNPTYGELVFRWRVAQSDRADLDEKAYEQEVTLTGTADSSTGGTDFTIATFNILHSDDAAWRDRLERSVQTLVNAQVDVAGLQEVRPDQNKAFREGSGGSIYQMYPAVGSQGPGFTPNPIIWNKEKYEMVRPMPDLKVSYFEDSVGETSQEVPTVVLRDKVTGQQFIVANTHDPADTKNHGENSDLRLANANRYAEYYTKLSEQTQLPIFLVGDFNNRYDVTSKRGNDPLNNLCTNLTYRIISKAGTLRDAYDASVNRTAPDCPAKAATSGNMNSIDHIFASTSVEVDQFKNLNNSGTGKNGSDHNTVVAHVTIPSSEVVGDGAFTVSTYNFCQDDNHSCPGVPGGKSGDITNKVKTLTSVFTGSGKLGNPQMDIVAAQEVSQGTQASVLSTLSSSYQAFPAKVSKNSGRAIFWNKDKFSLEDSGCVTGVHNNADSAILDGKTNCPSDQSGQSLPDGFPWVKLRSGDGKTVFVLSIHTPTSSRGGTMEVHNNNAKAFLNWTRSKADDTNIVVVAGDFNDRSEASNIQKSTYCTLTPEVLRHAADIQRGDSGKCPSGASLLGTDEIYLTPSTGVAVKGWHRIEGGRTADAGTDHSPAWATVRYTGDKTATTKGTSSLAKITTVPNLRDAGEATGVIKKGLLYRSGKLSEVSSKDAAALSALLLGKNGTIIDLQSTNDKAYAKDKIIGDVSQGAPLGIPATVKYTQFVDNRIDREGFNEALRKIANARGPVLVHCHHGNDRTGWTVAMVMYTLGASDDQVMKEYLTSGGVPKDGSWLYNGLNDVQRKFGSPGKKGYRDAVMKYLTTSIDGGGLGLSRQTLDNIKNGLAN